MADECFYVDEAVRELEVPDDKYNRKLTAIGAGIGVKKEKVELLDWCGLLYYHSNNHSNGRNGNGYWQLLGYQALEVIQENSRKLRPEKIYACNQIAFYIIKAMISSDLPYRELKKLSNIIKPVIQKDYRSNGIYKAKQEVGKLVRKKLKVDISKDTAAKVLEGRLYDLRSNMFIELRP